MLNKITQNKLIDKSSTNNQNPNLLSHSKEEKIPVPKEKSIREESKEELSAQDLIDNKFKHLNVFEIHK